MITFLLFISVVGIFIIFNILTNINDKIDKLDNKVDKQADILASLNLVNLDKIEIDLQKKAEETKTTTMNQPSNEKFNLTISEDVELDKIIEHSESEIDEEIDETKVIYSEPEDDYIVNDDNADDPIGEFGNRILHWLFADFIIKIGAVMVISGLIFLLNIGITSGVITPTIQVILAILISSGFIGIGNWQIQKKQLPGQILFLIGSFGLLLSTLGARHIYSMISSEIAFVIIILIQSFTMLISYIYQKRSLAIVGLITAGIAPFIIGSQTANYEMLVVYGFSLFGLILPFVFKTGWKGLSTIAMVISFLYSGALIQINSGDRLLWIVAYLVIFNFANLIGILSTKKLDRYDYFNTFAINTLSVIWIGYGAQANIRSLVLVAVTVFYLVTSLILSKTKVLANYIQIQFFTGLITFGIALTLQYLNQPAILTVLLFAEVLIAMAIALFVLKKPKMTPQISLFNTIPLLIAIFNYPGLIVDIYSKSYSYASSGINTLLYTSIALFMGISYWLVKHSKLKKNQENELMKNYYKAGLISWLCTIILIISGLLFAPISGSFSLLIISLIVFVAYTDKKIMTNQDLNNILLAISVLSGFRAIWIGSQYLLNSPSYSAGLSMVIYSIIALILNYYRSSLSSFWKNTHYIIFGFIIIRLFAVEFWTMPILARFVTFIVVGILFLLTPYINNTKK